VKLAFARTIGIAALLALQTATAAELPLRQAQPAAAPAARKCQVNGQDGVILPGSETCLRLGGYVSARTAVGAVGGSRKIGAP
jgi:hypothetical protein